MGLELKADGALMRRPGLDLDVGEHLQHLLADQILAARAEIFQGALRQKGQPSLGISGPEHADAELLDIIKHAGARGQDGRMRFQAGSRRPGARSFLARLLFPD